MLDEITGNVFSVGQGLNTQNMSIENHMKAMGAVNGSLEYDPEEPEDLIQTGTDATSEYYNQIKRLNDMGMRLAAKGIDVLNPNNNTPKVMSAVRGWQDQLSRVKSSASGLVTGQRVAEEYTKNRLQKNVFGKGFGNNSNGVATTEDLNNLVNTHPITEALNGIVKETNDNFSKSYDSSLERDDANLQIDSARTKLDALRGKILEQGLPNEVASYMIDSAKAQLGKATHDPLAVQELGIKQQNQVRKEKDSESMRARRAEQNKASRAKRSAEGYSALAKKVRDLNENKGWEEFYPWPNPGGDQPDERGWDGVFFGEETNSGDYVVVGVEHDDGRAQVYLAPKDSEGEIDLTKYTQGQLKGNSELVSRPFDNNFIRDMLGASEYGKYIEEAKEFTDESGNVKSAKKKYDGSKVFKDYYEFNGKRYKTEDILNKYGKDWLGAKIKNGQLK